MALTWSVKKVADYEHVCLIVAPADDPNNGVEKGDTIWSPVTMAVVWACMDMGLGEITEDNAAEFYARLHVAEKLFGPKLIRAVDPETGGRPTGQDAMITPDEVRQHIGLTVNVTPETRAKWSKRTLDYEMRSSIERFSRQREEAMT